MIGLLRALIGPGEARAALGRGLLAIALLVGDAAHFDTIGLAYNRELHLAEGVAVWARRRLDPPAPAVLPAAATLDAVASSSDLTTFTPEEWERIWIWARIDGRQPAAAQPWGDTFVRIAWSPDFIATYARPSIENRMSCVRPAGRWVFRPW